MKNNLILFSVFSLFLLASCRGCSGRGPLGTRSTYGQSYGIVTKVEEINAPCGHIIVAEIQRTLISGRRAARMNNVITETESYFVAEGLNLPLGQPIVYDYKYDRNYCDEVDDDEWIVKWTLDPMEADTAKIRIIQ
jgi:hypothetical protein